MSGASGWGMFFTPSMFSTGLAFDALADHLGDFSEPLRRAVEEVMIPSFKQNFAQEGRPPWAPTKEPAASLSTSILFRTGMLRNNTASLGIWSIDSSQAAVTDTPTQYAAYHQFGTSNMPARPFIVMQEEDADAIEQLFADWAVESVFS